MDKKGKLYALLVGINQYQNPAVKNLEYAVADVEGLKNFMMQRMGISEDNHICLVNPTPGDLERVPIRNQMLKYLNDYSTAPMESDDTFIFYFAGHGYEKNEVQYLLTVDSNPESEELLEDTAVSIPRLRKYLKKIRAGNQLLILDACRNDPHNLERGVDANTTDGSIMARDIAVIAKDMQKRNLRKFAIITASREGQVSFEYPDGKHSWFCFNLLECLKEEPGPMVDILTLNEKIIDRMKQRAWKELPIAVSQFPDIIIMGGRLTLNLAKARTEQHKSVKKEREVNRLILDFYTGDNLRKRFYILSQQELRLGRSSQYNDIAARVYPIGEPNDKENPNWRISRNHLKIFFESEKFKLVDEGSTYGTFLNDQPVIGNKSDPLFDGDMINLGGVLSLKVNIFYNASSQRVSSLRLRRFENQPECKEEYILIVNEAMIGKNPGCCLEINDRSVSGIEARIYLDKYQFYFQNLDQHGIYSINRNKISYKEHILLNTGIILQKGEIKFEIRRHY